jgi:hypothetical protein
MGRAEAKAEFERGVAELEERVDSEALKEALAEIDLRYAAAKGAVNDADRPREQGEAAKEALAVCVADLAKREAFLEDVVRLHPKKNTGYTRAGLIGSIVAVRVRRDLLAEQVA